MGVKHLFSNRGFPFDNSLKSRNMACFRARCSICAALSQTNRKYVMWNLGNVILHLLPSVGDRNMPTLRFALIMPRNTARFTYTCINIFGGESETSDILVTEIWFCRSKRKTQWRFARLLDKLNFKADKMSMYPSLLQLVEEAPKI